MKIEHIQEASALGDVLKKIETIRSRMGQGWSATVSIGAGRHACDIEMESLFAQETLGKIEAMVLAKLAALGIG